MLPSDAINHRDLPVMTKPRQVVLRVATRDRLVEPDDEIEVWIVSRERIEVIDFYRGRPG